MLDRRGFWTTSPLLQQVLALFGLGNVGLVMLEPDSIMHRVVEAAGIPGWFVLSLLGTASIAALADALAMRVVPEARALTSVVVGRQLALILMSFAWLALGFASAHDGFEGATLHTTINVYALVALLVGEVTNDRRARIRGPDAHDQT